MIHKILVLDQERFYRRFYYHMTVSIGVSETFMSMEGGGWRVEGGGWRVELLPPLPPLYTMALKDRCTDTMSRHVT